MSRLRWVLLLGVVVAILVLLVRVRGVPVEVGERPQGRVQAHTVVARVEAAPPPVLAASAVPVAPSAPPSSNVGREQAVSAERGAVDPRPRAADRPVAPIQPAIAREAPAAPTDDADAGTRYPVSRDGIRNAVRAALPGISDCYSEWLKVQPDLGGKVRVTFTIDTDDGVNGDVKSVSLGDAGIGHFAMEGCILSVFKDLRFEAPLDGPISVTYPIALAPSDDGSR